MKRPVLLLAALLLVAADPPREEAIKKEREKLRGSWVDVTDSTRMIPVPADKGLAIQDFTSDKISTRLWVKEGGKIVTKDVNEMSFTLDPTKNPKTIDFTLIKGPGKGKTYRGIYQFDGDDLKLCFPADPDGARPAKLEKTKQTQLLQLRRYSPESVKKQIDFWEKTLDKLLERIQPPISRMAKPIDPKAADILYLSLNEQSWVEIGGGETLKTQSELRYFLKEQFAAKVRELGPGKVKTVVVLRPDKNAEVLPLYQVAQHSLAQGFPKVFVQVLRTPAEEGRLELVLPHWRRPESFADVLVLVKCIRNGTVKDGAISALIVQIGQEEMALPSVEKLEQHLKQKREKGDLVNKDSVQIVAESKLLIGPLIEVMDACLASGFPSVTVGPPPDDPFAEARPAARRPAPDAAAQAKAEKEIKTIYQALYAKPEPADLARRLRQAGDICDEPAARFVLLREAADAAGRAGDITASLDALDQLAKDYSADVWSPKLDKFKKAPANKAVVEAALRQAGNASTQGRLDYGVRFLRLAEIAANEMKDKDLIDFVEERRVSLKLPRVDDLDPFAPLPSSGSPAKQKAEAKTASEPSTEPDDSSQLQHMILWYVLPAGCTVLVLGGVLVWWLRRGDRAVQSRLAEARKGQFALPAEEEPVEPPPQATEQAPPG
jgi:uncharacterized protein (TIGR03067 family)